MSSCYNICTVCSSHLLISHKILCNFSSLMKFVMFCFLTGYIVFVNGLCSNIHAADFPLPCCSHKKGNPYCLLAIKLAELLCFRFRLTSSAQILEGDEKIWLYILEMREENQFTVMDPFDELDLSSDEIFDFYSPESPKQTLILKFMCSRWGEYINFLYVYTSFLLKDNILLLTESAGTIHKDRRRWAFNFFHADQQETRFLWKHKPTEAYHFKLIWMNADLCVRGHIIWCVVLSDREYTHYSHSTSLCWAF